MCDRWHKLPGEVMAEDMGVFRLLKVMELGEGGDDGEPG